MSRRAGIAWTAILLVALTMVVYLRRGNGSSGAEGEGAGADDATPVPAAVEPGGVEDDDSSPEPRRARSDEGDRIPQREPVLTGRVTDGEGAPLEGVAVTWVPSLDALSGSWEGVREHVSRASLEVHTGDSGVFRFDRLPGTTEGGRSSVWLSHPGYGLLGLDLPEDREAWSKGEEHTLTRAEVTRVRVEKSGAPASGARVHQVFRPSTPGAGAFHRELVTNAAGEAGLYSSSDTQVLVAQHGNRISAPWVGVPVDTVLLELEPSFELAGRIVRGPELTDAERVTITCVAIDGARSTEVARVEGVLDEWGPLTLPVLDAEEYVVRMRGETVIPRDAILEPPRAGASLRVTHDAGHGNALWFLVVDEEESPLPEARAVGSWREDGRRITTEGHARADGYLPLAGCRTGSLDVVISCPGYASVRLPMAVPEEEPVAHMVLLPRGGRVSGRCTHAGEPVEDFSVSVWPASQEASAEARPFSGRSQGTFELDSVPLGRAALAASVPGVGISDPVYVDVGEEPVEDVQLEIPETIRARGRVVEAGSGGPVSDAVVFVHMGAGQEVVRRVGRPVRTRADGTFEIAGLQRGPTSVGVEAEGYSAEQVRVTTAVGEEADLGVIALNPRQPLLVRVKTEGDLDPSRCTISARDPTGGAAIPPTGFDSAGNARFESVAANRYRFRLDVPDGSSVRLDARLVPGEEWIVSFDLTGRGVVHVLVEPEEGMELPIDLSAEIEYEGVGKNAYLARPVVDGNATLYRISPGYVQLTVHSPEELLARKRFVLGAGERKEMRIALGEAEPDVRVVGSDGVPLPGVSVTAHLEGSAGFGVGSVFETGADGTCRITGLAEMGGTLHLSHPTAGRRAEIEVSPRGPDEEIELVLDGRVDVEAVFEDAHGGVSGLRANLLAPSGNHAVEVSFTDAAGRVPWRDLTAGEYMVYVDDPRYWPVERIVEVQPGGGTIAIPLWARCDLDLLVREEGLQRAGLDLDVVHVESGLSLEEILADPLVRSSATTATTDSTGRLTASGVPEGEYRWSVSVEVGAGVPGPASGDASGSLHLSPGAGDLTIDLP